MCRTEVLYWSFKLNATGNLSDTSGGVGLQTGDIFVTLDETIIFRDPRESWSLRIVNPNSPSDSLMHQLQTYLGQSAPDVDAAPQANYPNKYTTNIHSFWFK